MIINKIYIITYNFVVFFCYKILKNAVQFTKLIKNVYGTVLLAVITKILIKNEKRCLRYGTDRGYY